MWKRENRLSGWYWDGVVKEDLFDDHVIMLLVVVYGEWGELGSLQSCDSLLYELLRIICIYTVDNWSPKSCLSSGFIESVEWRDNWNTQWATALCLKFVKLICGDIKKQIIAVVKES